VVDDPRRLEYLRGLVARLAPHMRNRDRYPAIDVTLIDAPIADGQSFPGGLLVFTTGLLREPDEATVAGVVAHELAHLDRGHLYEYARRARFAETAMTRPPSEAESWDQFFTRGMALFGQMMNPFRPEHELEADCTAATWMYQEGLDPRALVGYFERLHRALNDQPVDPAFPFWRSHPYSLDRRREVLDRLAQLRRWRPAAALGLFPERLRRLEVPAAEPGGGR
jgi:predicted Zn-dependent protease